MKLEKGRYYKTRDGRKAYCMGESSFGSRDHHGAWVVVDEAEEYVKAEGYELILVEQGAGR